MGRLMGSSNSNNYGEQIFINKASEYLDDTNIIYWNRQLFGKEFDVCILMPEKGILVVELKGWREENILRIENNDSVIIQTDDGEVSASPQKQARGYRFSIERHIRQNIGKFPLVYQMVCLPQISKAFFKSRRLDVVMEEKFTILKEDLKDNTSFFNKLDQALREVCHWNRDPFDRRTMLEVRNLFETDINVDEDGESEIEKELASSYHRHDYSRFYYFNEFDQMSGNTINDMVVQLALSKAFVERAERLGIEHDKKYRNLNGMKMMFQNVAYVASNGDHGMSAASSAMRKVYDMSNSSPEVFDLILKEFTKRYLT